MPAVGLVAGAMWSAASVIPAMVQDIAAPPANTLAGTRFVRTTPDAWLPSVSGSTRATRSTPSLSIDQSFSDILSDLDFAAMIAGTVCYDRIGLLVDHGVQAKSSW